MADPMFPCPDPGSCSCAEAFARLEARHEALRAEIAEGVTTRRVVIVDPDGAERIRLTAGDGGALITLADGDHDRVRLAARGDHGEVQVRSRPAQPDGDATHVVLFALDAEDGDDHPYVGVELVERGDTAGGLSLYETHRPHLWWADPDDPDDTDEPDHPGPPEGSDRPDRPGDSDRPGDPGSPG